ncbi:hypothetical protein Tco_0317648 [Tanacetum coccineum]
MAVIARPASACLTFCKAAFKLDNQSLELGSCDSCVGVVVLGSSRASSNRILELLSPLSNSGIKALFLSLSGRPHLSRLKSPRSRYPWRGGVSSRKTSSLRGGISASGHRPGGSSGGYVGMLAAGSAMLPPWMRHRWFGHSDSLPCHTETLSGQRDLDLRWSRCGCRSSFKCLVSRLGGNRCQQQTGYTGEFGSELGAPPSSTLPLVPRKDPSSIIASSYQCHHRRAHHYHPLGSRVKASAGRGWSSMGASSSEGTKYSGLFGHMIRDGGGYLADGKVINPYTMTRGTSQRLSSSAPQKNSPGLEN